MLSPREPENQKPVTPVLFWFAVIVLGVATFVVVFYLALLAFL
jgi:hypothetical protein